MKSILILFLFSLNVLYAQNYFVNKYQSPINDAFYSTLRTSDDGCYFLSASQGINITRVDAVGNLLWTKSYIVDGMDNPRSFDYSRDSGLIIVGSTLGFHTTTIDYSVIRLDLNGNTVWTKIISSPSGDLANFVKTLVDSNYVMSGNSNGNLLIKIDDNGDTLWVRNTGDYEVFVILPTPDTGFITFGMNDFDMAVCKFNSQGYSEWMKEYVATGNTLGSTSINKAGNGYIITGSSSTGPSDQYAIRIDSIGNLLWSYTYGTLANEKGIYVAQTPDSGFLLNGSTNNPVTDKDFVLIKIDANGNIIWSKAYGEGDLQFPRIAFLQSNGNIVVAGEVSNFSYSDVYLFTTDANGNNSCNDTIFSPLINPLNVIVTDDSLQISNYPINVSSIATQVSTEIQPLQVCTSVGVNDLYEQLNVIFKQTTDKLQIEFKQSLTDATLNIYSINGNIILSKKLTGTTETILTDQFSAGMYLVTVNDNGKSYTNKFFVGE